MEEHPQMEETTISDASASEPASNLPGMEGNAWDSYDTVFLNAKAGMDGVDKKKVQKVVYDMSKGSRYFNNEQRKEADVARRIDNMRALAVKLTPVQLAEHEKTMDMKVAELEAGRDLSRVWMHVDMDAFYAAVETLVNPTLAGKAMAVGGMSMICTANYEARKFGVRAAMPGFIARKLCPNLIFVRPDFKKYTHYSELSRKVFKDYDPEFVPRSLDEAYIDITKTCQSRNMSGAEVAEELCRRIQSETGLTCSAGVGPNRLLAKVCSDINKPNGQFVLSPERGAVVAFISSLPIRKVSGIGKVTERLLKDVLGINTCADLLSKRAYLPALFSEISTNFFLAVALGIGGSETPERESRKSLSNERTFAAISTERQLFQKLEELVDLLVTDMQKEGLEGRTLTLKLKETGFEVRSRAITLPSYVSGKAEIWEHATKLLRAELPLSLRLMGLRISHFKGERGGPSDPSQRTLTSFITQTSPVSSRRHRQKSKGSNDDISLTSKTNLDFPFDSADDDCSSARGDAHATTDEKIRPNSSCIAEGLRSVSSMDAMSPTVITLDLQSHKGNSASTCSKTQQAIDGFAVSRSPKSPVNSTIGKVGRGTAPLGRDGVGMAHSTCAEDVPPKSSMASRQLEKSKSYQRDPHVAQDEASASGLATKPRGTVEEDDGQQPLNPQFMEEDGNLSSDLYYRRIPTAIMDELENEQVGDSTTLGTSEPSWQELQSGYDDSHQEKIWTNDNRCLLCGVVVDGLIPTARQEHEDFHFALWLQQQKEEKSELRRLRNVTTPSKKPSRPAAREISSAGRKRKGKKSHSTAAKKSYSHCPLEVFFNKAK